jgi:hypothetical protein
MASTIAVKLAPMDIPMENIADTMGVSVREVRREERGDRKVVQFVGCSRDVDPGR